MTSLLSKDYVEIGRLQVDRALSRFIENDVLPGTGLTIPEFWQAADTILHDLSPRNAALLKTRAALQAKIDQWHVEQAGQPIDAEAHLRFLKDIGYAVEPPGPTQISSANMDAEITSVPGPQLVVPVMNARYALNAANARWVSLYDALYGTDVISEEAGAERTATYSPNRGAKVVTYAKAFLDRTVPLKEGSYDDVVGHDMKGGELVFHLSSGADTALRDPAHWSGHGTDPDGRIRLLFKHHGLHIELLFDPTHPVGAADPWGLCDVVLESALTVIMDCEDSVAAVDADDKVAVYRNWLGLNKGTLTAAFAKQGATVDRCLNDDRLYQSPVGEEFTLPGRSLMLVRNVGLLMTTDAILLRDGTEVPEGLLDGLVTTLIAMHDLNGNGRFRNSRAGSVYIVKPKLHGPEEVSFTCEFFTQVEQAFGLPRNTIKIGIMDEERRTSINLRACIAVAKDRVFFINTGFLDRTGDEIHTAMKAGPVIRKNDIKQENWIAAYEKLNVEAGLSAGFRTRAQIGKGMWAMPDLMADMMDQKAGQLRAGATTAWVPSPTAAGLHAMHYHEVDVAARQQELAEVEATDITALLELPLLADITLSADDIQQELDNNAQGILGYVVRWVDQGIGCSKVPDINDVGLMEDRATLRISSQHMANWLGHGLCSEAQVMETFRRMAKVVDGQNSDDPAYKPMSANFDDSLAFEAAYKLVLDGAKQPSGYTEPLLHKYRREAKARLGRA